MNKIDYLLIKNMTERVLREPRYSWMVDSDVLLSKEDFIQEVFLRYLPYRDSVDVHIEPRLYTFVASRVKNVKRDIDRSSIGAQDELEDSVPFKDCSLVRVSVRDAINHLNCTDTITKNELDLLFRYYVYGETYQDMAEALEYKNKSGVKNKLDRLIKKLTPEFKELLSDIKGVDMC